MSYLSSESLGTYARGMSGATSVASAGSARVDVRLAKAVIEALRELPPRLAAVVARAIQRIGAEPGVSLRIQAPGNGGKPYMAMVPGDDAAPVVIYRELSPDEGGDYLVTGLGDREAYVAYESAEQQGFLDTPAGHALILLAVGAAVAIALRAAARGGVGAS
jgi:hypothetical protein